MLNAFEIFVFYLYGLPLFIINLRTLYVLWFDKTGRFSSTYLRIFSYCVFNECLLYVTNNYALRLPSIQVLYDVYFSNFTEFSRFNTPILFVKRFCSYFVNFANLLLSLNRLTAVWKYAGHENLWLNNKFMWMSFMFGGTFICSGQELINSARFSKISVENSTVVIVQLISNNYFNPINTLIVAAPLIMTFTVASILCSVIAYLIWQKRKMAIPTDYRNFEVRLIFLTITFYGLGVFVSIYNGIKTTIFNPVEQWYSYVIVSDSVALLPSVFFLVASSGLREAVFPDEFRVRLWRLYMQTMCQNVSFTSYTTPTSIQLTNSRNNPNGAVSMIPRPVVSMSSMPSQKLILTARDTQSSHPALIII